MVTLLVHVCNLLMYIVHYLVNIVTCMLWQGCSAGIISVELVKNILAAKPNSTALVVSTENLTQNLYLGNERGFLLQNTLFRCGE